MFVHLGMDIEKQWEKAVNSLMNMSNLEVALVWRKLSSLAPPDDYRMHSEYKCLFKRACREAESRVGGGVTRVVERDVDSSSSSSAHGNACHVEEEDCDAFEYTRDSGDVGLRHGRRDLIDYVPSDPEVPFPDAKSYFEQRTASTPVSEIGGMIGTPRASSVSSSSRAKGYSLALRRKEIARGFIEDIIGDKITTAVNGGV